MIDRLNRQLSLLHTRTPIGRSYVDFEVRGVKSASINVTTQRIIYYHDGLVDGGNIGEPSKAMDYLDIPLDGGTI